MLGYKFIKDNLAAVKQNINALQYVKDLSMLENVDIDL